MTWHVRAGVEHQGNRKMPGGYQRHAERAARGLPQGICDPADPATGRFTSRTRRRKVFSEPGFGTSPWVAGCTLRLRAARVPAPSPCFLLSSSQSITEARVCALCLFNTLKGSDAHSFLRRGTGQEQQARGGDGGSAQPANWDSFPAAYTFCLGQALALAAAPHLVSHAGLPALPVLLTTWSRCVLKSLHSEKLSSP